MVVLGLIGGFWENDGFGEDGRESEENGALRRRKAAEMGRKRDIIEVEK